MVDYLHNPRHGFNKCWELWEWAPVAGPRVGAIELIGRFRRSRECGRRKRSAGERGETAGINLRVVAVVNDGPSGRTCRTYARTQTLPVS